MGRTILLAGVLCAIGCDKLPWPPKGKNSKTVKATASSTTASAATASTTATSAGAPTKPAILPSDIVATVNGVPISKADIELRIKELKTLWTSLKQEWKPLSASDLEAVLKELVNTELMSQNAVARGLDRSMDVQRRWAFIRRGFFAQEWLSWNRDRLDISSADVEQYYEQHKVGFREPERRRLKQLVVTSEDQAKQALAKILGESTDFSTLAQQVSVGPTAKEGGLLPEWVMRTDEKLRRYGNEPAAKAAGVISLDPALEAAAFAVDHENGVSNYVKGSDNRYHMFQLVKRETEQQIPINKVWDDIKGYLTTQKLQQTLDDLTNKAKIEKFPERLSDAAQ